MSRAANREWSVEEFDRWSAATDKFERVAAAADEEGGPRLSLVPQTDREIPWPTDLLPPAGDPAVPGDASTGEPPVSEQPVAEPFDGVALADSRIAGPDGAPSVSASS